MTPRDPRITRYIATAAPFARPLLDRLRRDIHAASPDLVEAVKWGMPAFLHRGKIVCGIAAFKGHCALWFWKGREVVGKKTTEGLGSFGRITGPRELPSAASIRRYVRKAVSLIDAAIGDGAARGLVRARKS